MRYLKKQDDRTIAGRSMPGFFRINPRLLILTVWLYGVLLLALVTLSYWPAPLWPFATFISYLPVWLWLLPGLILLPLCLLAKHNTLVIVVILSFCLWLKLSGAVIHFATTETNTDTLVIMEANMQDADLQALNRALVENNADIIALQNITQTELTPLLDISPLNVVCVEQLCLLSHLNLKLVATKSSALWQKTEQFAMQIAVSLPQPGSTALKTIDFYVVQFKSPNHAFKQLLTSPLGGWYHLHDALTELRTEAWLAANWVIQGRNPIIAGSFNLPRNHPVYLNYWHTLSNSFETAGSGWGYTKHSFWQPMDSEHILHSAAWQSEKTWLGPSLGGQHRPLITVLTPLSALH